MTGICLLRKWLFVGAGVLFAFRSFGQSEVMTAPFVEDWSRGSHLGLQGWEFETLGPGRIAVQPGEAFTGFENTAGSHYTGGNRFRGNKFRADDDDILLGHELFLVRTTPTEVRFYVYECATISGSYTRINSVTRYLPEGEGFVGSGAISVSLKAGYYYVIGAAFVESAEYSRTSGVTFPLSSGNITGVSSAQADTLPGVSASFTTFTIPYSQRLRLAGDPDEIPATASTVYDGGALHGNIYRVDGDAQRLTGHGMYLGRNPDAVAVELAVYESPTRSGTYTRIDLQSVTAPAGTNFVGVATDIPLTKNSYYLLTAAYAGDVERFAQTGFFATPADLGEITGVEGFYSGVTSSPATLNESASQTNNTCYRQQLWVDSKPALRMDHSGSTSLYSTNAASIRVDANGYSHLYLNFKHREAGDDLHAADGVFLSDGTTTTRLYALEDTAAWTEYTIDLIPAATAAGLYTSGSLYIHFQQSDNYPWATDGREFTDIRIYSNSDLLWEEFDTGDPSYLFRGFGATKTIPVIGVIGMAGGLSGSSAMRYIRRQLLDSVGTVYNSQSYFFFEIPAMGHAWADYSGSISIPAATALTQSLYYAKGILDASNTLNEGREGNNEKSVKVNINHYSGILYFDDIETEIQISDWDYQSGHLYSPTHHLISGTGTIDGYSFDFTDMLVEKDLATLDYHISTAEARDFTVNGTIDVTTTVHSVRFTYLDNAVLNKDGGDAEIDVILPAGAGFVEDPQMPYADPRIRYLPVELGPGLMPVGTYTGAPPEDFMFEESKPLIFEISSYTWLADQGRFEFPLLAVRFIHKSALDTLDGLASIPAGEKLRRGNDGYYRYVRGIPGSKLEIAPAADGTALAAFEVEIEPGSMTAHLPYDVKLNWIRSGLVTVADDIVSELPSKAFLEGVQLFRISYLASCPGNCGGAEDAVEVGCESPSGYLLFTADGGLYSEVDFTAGYEDLRWGSLIPGSRYAQVAMGFTRGVFHMPGHFVDGDDDLPAAVGEADTPAAILFTGVRSTGHEMIRPLTQDYTDGIGSYGGVTVNYESGCQGRSILGDTYEFGYALYSGCKYYIRRSGVTGMHVADASLGSVSAVIYGYPFTFDTYALSYLSSENIESATEGSTAVPRPCNFELYFDELLLTCLGDLDEATPAEKSSKIGLEYWAATVSPSHIDFVPTKGCTPGNSVLALSISTEADNIPSRLYGTIGVLNDGNLAAANDSVPGIDSRLSVPTTIEIDGPDGQTYKLSTVSPAYFNDYRHAGSMTSMGAGLLTLAGELDVPFFENMLVQVFTSGGSGGTSPLTMTGGWPESGWTGTDGSTYFDNINFDPDNAAHPPALNLAAYLACTETDYIPFAKRDWLGPIGFGIHVAWDSASKSFRAPQPEKNDFFVINTEYDVPQLTADRCEITFGLRYGDLPALNLSSIFFNAVDEATGVAEEFKSVVQDAISDAIDEGIGAVEDVLDADPAVMIENALADQMDPMIDDLYNALVAAYGSGSGYYTNAINTYVRGTGGAYANDLNELLQKIIDGSGQAVGIAADLQATIDKAITTVDALTIGLPDDPEDPLMNGADGLLNMVGNDYPLLETLGRILMIFAIPSLMDADNQIEDAFASVMETVEPAINSINETLLETKTELENIRDQLDAVGEFHQELTDAIDSLEIDTLADEIGDRLEGRLAELEGTFSPYTNYTPEEVKAMIREVIFDALRESAPILDLKRIVRARLLDTDRRVRAGIDSIFAQLTWAMQDVLSDIVGELDTGINGMLGDLSDTIGTGNIEGYAHIYNDSLDILRLDAEIQMKVPDEMEYKGYLEIVNEQATSDSGCAFASGDTYKVTFGAEDVSCSWLGSDTTLDVFCTVTIHDSIPKGLGGGLEINGKIDFEGMSVERFAAEVAFGALENYISASTELSSGSVTIMGGIFFGRTCTIGPLEIVDPNAGEILGEPPFTGAYLYGEGWMPIYDYGCLFRIKAGAGLGVFYFLEGPTYGVRIMLGASGEALCVVSIKGEVELYGLKQGDSYKARGTGKISGKVGACPFCVKFKKSVKITYEDGDWDADY